MLDLLVKSAVRRKILGLFALNMGHELYARKVARAVGESPHAVGLELRHLAEGGLLATTKHGRQTFYRWNDGYPFASDLTNIVRKMRIQGDREMNSLPDLAQLARINNNLQAVVRDLKRYYDPDKIILFGSVVSGKTGPHSDIDLVVIKRTSLPFFKRAQQLAELLDYDVDIDFLVYTPEEFDRMARERRFFREEVLKKGKVIYDRAA